jgi:putative FmdB family regulatory protein
MPIFEYWCKHCQIKFEEFLFPFEREKKPTCPHCGEKETEKLFSAFGFRSGGEFTPSTGSSSCESCSSKQCTSCAKI